MSNWSARPANGPALRLEELEGREVPAVLIQIDYSYDNGFFANNPDARATLEQVAAELGNSISADLSALTPGGGNTWTATFYNPTTGALQAMVNPTVAANTVRVFVGARPLAGGEAGLATTTGFDAAGAAGWVSTVQTRNWSGFAPWGGSIAFDSAQNWNFSTSTSGLTASKLDFYSVATHEMGHVLGMGTSNQWNSLSSGGYFHGANASGVYGGAVPLSPDGIHWADGISVGGHAVSLDPSLAYGRRVSWSSLDAAALRDLGWGAAAPASAAPTPPVVLVAVAGADGLVTQYAIYNGALFATGQRWAAFPGYGGPLQQAIGDFDGDGAYDVAVATPAAAGFGALAVISGRDGHYIGAPRLTLGGTVLGLAAYDADGDGRPELLTAEGRPLGVYLYTVGGGALSPYATVHAYGTPGRAALRATGGDVSRDGYGDTVSGAAPSDTAPARPDGTGDGGVMHAAKVAPAPRQCTCAGCAALARLGGADKTVPTLPPGVGTEDELMSGIRVG